MESIKIFFSWASEHDSTKRFILNILERVKQKLLVENICVEINESTANIVGFVRIEDIILKRIEECDFFVADLTPIPVEKWNKPITNSNVSFELGYMIGRHGVDRVFGMCNTKYLSNPASDLPFDFSHNRVMRISSKGTNEEKEKNIENYAETIASVILGFNKNGNLHSVQPLTKHDGEVNERISVDMERFKELVNGIERFECFSGGNSTTDEPGDYDFLTDLAYYLENQKNHFANASLEVYRKELYIAIVEFVHIQAMVTYNCYLGIGGSRFIYCTKMYVINNFPEVAEDNHLPNSLKMDNSNFEKAIVPFEEESKKYRDAANKIIECYGNLEKRYLSLVD